jgi:RHS repeat-associated protein
VTIDYYPASSFSLPSDVYEYAADGSTLLRRSHTDYNLNPIYTDRRIIGLVFGQYVYDGGGALQSKQLYHRDWDGYWLVDQGAAVGHDNANYGVSFVNGRANLVLVEHYDVQYPDDQTRVLSVKTGYNTNGSVIFSGDGMWHRSDISYADAFSDGVNRNTFAFPTTVTDPDGFSSTAQYNYDFGAGTRTQDPKGAVSTMAYDSAGRISQVTNAVNGAYTRWVYPSSMGYVERFTTIQQGAGEAESADFFDGWGKVRASESDHPGSVGLHSAVHVMYDAMGRVVMRSNPTEISADWATVGDDAAGWVWTYQSYDWKGRPLLTTNPDNTTTEATYGGCGCAGGEVTTVRDERGRRRRLTKDVLGRLKQVDELNWDQSIYATTVYNYNARDQLTSSIQSGQVRSFSYDGYGRLSAKYTPEQGTTSYSYFLNDTVQTMTDARGATTTFAYNNRDLVTSITYGVPAGVAVTPNVSFGYDVAGNRTSMTDGLGSVSYAYNTLSQMTSETRTFSGVSSFSLSYGYNLAGELTSVTNPWGVVVGYNYDSVGRPTSVSGSGYAGVPSYVNNIAYRAFGMKQMSYANGKTLSMSYDNRMRMTQWNVPGVMGWNYFYNNFNESTGRATYAQNLYDATLDRSYDYDQLGRLIASYTGSDARAHIGTGSGTGDGPYAQLYGYDVWGNIVSRQGWGGANPSSTASFTNNRMNGFGYDAAGNLTDAGGGWTFTYDATGQQATSAMYNLQQYYDGDRMRAKKVEAASGNTPVFTDDPLVAGVTEVKAIHLTELRAAVNQARARAGLAAATWTDANVQPNVTLIKAVHIQELRARLDEARAALGLPAASYTDPTLTVGVTTVKAAHVQDLRERVKEAQAAATVTYYVRSTVLGGQVVAELNGSGGWTRGYVYLGGQMVAVQQQSAVNWMHEDPVAKSKRVTDSAGTVVSAVELDPWGGETNRSSNEVFQPKKFTSYERDVNGSDEAMHRRYNRWWARFEQPDPYDGSYSFADPQSFNRYSYVQNDPVNFSDPRGLLIWAPSIGNFTVDVPISFGGQINSFLWEHLFGSPTGPIGGTTDTGGPGVEEIPQDNRTDCKKLADITEQIANDAANVGDFIQRMVNKFIGPNLNVNSRADLERAGNMGNREFGASGFRQQFVDLSNQVRHFTGGLWAGYYYGPGVAQLGMNSREENTIIPGTGIMSAGGILPSLWPTNDSRADVALNSVSVPLGVDLTPRREEFRDVGDRGGWSRIPANPGYKGLAAAIRSQVCQQILCATYQRHS